jgi:hypothetical protein
MHRGLRDPVDRRKRKKIQTMTTIIITITACLILSVIAHTLLFISRCRDERDLIIMKRKADRKHRNRWIHE